MPSAVGAADIGRLDRAGYTYQTRADRAFENYLTRRQGDVARLDAATAERDRLRGVDLQRRDQAYYNYLRSLGAQAGFGTPAGQAVSAAGQAGGAVAGAYGQQGQTLANIYGRQGQTQAQIDWSMGQSINNMIQGGISNYLVADYAGLI